MPSRGPKPEFATLTFPNAAVEAICLPDTVDPHGVKANEYERKSFAPRTIAKINGPSNSHGSRDAFAGSSQCRQGLLDMDNQQNRKIRELRRPDLARQDYFESWPHTVDPRGPK